MGSILIDLTGKRFGRLLVVARAENVLPNEKRPVIVQWVAKCDCGKTSVVRGNSLKIGRTKSCGCLLLETSKMKATKHGLRSSAEYSAYQGMFQRCYGKRDFEKYGSRGIVVCQSWHRDNENGFMNFISDMGMRPTKNHSIDRIDNNGNYEPSNCRWALPIVQNTNQRSNIWVEYNGQRMVRKHFAAMLGVDQTTIRHHLKSGKTPNDIVAFYQTRRSACL